MTNNIIFDFDSTLVTIEGIDELARIKGVFEQIADLTNQAMNGTLALENVFAQRLDLIRPTTQDLQKVAGLYRQNITAGAYEFITQLQKNHRVFVVTGGYRQSVVMTTRYLGFPDDHVYANKLLHNHDGQYLGFDASLPLWKQTGKAEIIRQITQRFPGNCLVVGDGMSDACAKPPGGKFVQFYGVVNRPSVAEQADYSINTFSYQDWVAKKIL